MVAPSDLRRVADAVDGERVLRRLDELARLGGQADGGVTRIAFSQEEVDARELVAEWMTEAGLGVRFDWFGNTFGSVDSNAPLARVSMSGSHIDTVPGGGRLDGALGVVAAIEAVEAMQRSSRLPALPLEVVVWRCEEPVLFSQGKVGSLLFSESLAWEDLRPLKPLPDSDALLNSAAALPQRDPSRRVESVLELHIEQGCVLERAGRQVGVVTAIAAPVRLRVTFGGRADHSGTTPMGERRDALCGAAELVLAVETVALGEAVAGTVATVAVVDCRPGAINVVPDAVEVLIDVRGVNEPSMQRVQAQIRDQAKLICRTRSLDLAYETLSVGVPTRLRPEVVAAVAAAVRDIEYDPLLMVSGAGHDAQSLAGVADVAMIFVPSVGGVSHSPEERTADADLIAGARALAAAWYALASR